ncbi:MAG TPA: YMGG-like glycine zipper-containing protein [Blastocatellia bacterium]|nr:YMGG-like glycine zipper-containing protein [Blastocatellia bacterium]
MISSIRKNAVLMMLALGLVFTTMVPGAMAQDRCRSRSRQVYYDNNYYDNQRYDNRRYDDRRYDDRRYRDERYYDDRDYRDERNKRAVLRTGIGAAGGAVVGGLLGGKKGAVIGGIAGAAGGYLYHRHKENQRRY